MVMLIELLVTDAGLEQGTLDVITQVTTCPLVNAFVVYILEFVPTLTPDTFH